MVKLIRDYASISEDGDDANMQPVRNGGEGTLHRSVSLQRAIGDMIAAAGPLGQSSVAIQQRLGIGAKYMDYQMQSIIKMLKVRPPLRRNSFEQKQKVIKSEQGTLVPLLLVLPHDECMTSV